MRRAGGVALEADGLENVGEPGAEGGVGEDFKQIAVVREPQILVGPKSGTALVKTTAARYRWQPSCFECFAFRATENQVGGLLR